MSPLGQLAFFALAQVLAVLVACLYVAALVHLRTRHRGWLLFCLNVPVALLVIPGCIVAPALGWSYASGLRPPDWMYITSASACCGTVLLSILRLARKLRL